MKSSNVYFSSRYVTETCDIIFRLYDDSYDLEATWLISLTDCKITQPGMARAVNQEDIL